MNFGESQPLNMNTTDIKNSTEGVRFNEGKTRHDLVPAFAQEQYAQVLTKGALKYAERNWEKGMPWSKILASLERHLYAIKRGEDYDPETGLLHSAHVMCNAAFLTEYYKIYPQGDDRPLDYLQEKRIGIDIDEVLADFIGEYCARYKVEQPSHWEFDPQFDERYSEVLNDEDFWLNLKTIIPPEELPFKPTAYITARPEDLLEITKKWLFEINNYPIAPVVCTKNKLDAVRENELDAFIDDKIETFIKLNKNKELCYLFDTPQNQHINVGHKRIYRNTLKRVTCF